jgi:hypothetical protein
MWPTRTQPLPLLTQYSHPKTHRFDSRLHNKARGRTRIDVHSVNSASMYTLTDVAGKGKGLVAIEDVSRGT